jgi:hypothetical protein
MEQGFVLLILSLLLQFWETERGGPERIREMDSYVMSELRDHRGPYIVVSVRKMWICRGQKVVKVTEIGGFEGAPRLNGRVYGSYSLRASSSSQAI